MTTRRIFRIRSGKTGKWWRYETNQALAGWVDTPGLSTDFICYVHAAYEVGPATYYGEYLPDDFSVRIVTFVVRPKPQPFGNSEQLPAEPSGDSGVLE